MTDTLWLFLFAQMLMGALDTIYHHELTQRLAWRPSQAGELKLHGVRNLVYAVVFAAIGWSEPQGLFASALLFLMLAELVVTLWDFVEEDHTRKLPGSERVLHTLLTLNYGFMLAGLTPWLWIGAGEPTRLALAYHSVWSWICLMAAGAVFVWGLRDLAAARRAPQLKSAPAGTLAETLLPRRSVLVTGGTGFVGSRLVEALVAAGHDVTVLTRSREKAAALPAPIRVITSLEQVPDEARFDAIVNLAGEPVGDAPWTAAKRRKFLRSRLAATGALAALTARLREKPAVLISASAVGWYGDRGDEPLDERAAGGAMGFALKSCRRCERAAMAVERYGVRVVRLRIGLVLAAEGGFLSRLLTPFEFGLGAQIGSGAQQMSWIHRDDLVRLIAHAMATPALSGPVNATAPNPVTNRDFTRVLARALGRPVWLRLPAGPLRFGLGAFAEELLLGGQRVLPRAALASGFVFRYPGLDDALAEIVGCATRRLIPTEQGQLSRKR